MFTLKDMKARVVRLEELAKGLAAELELVKDAEQSVLLPAERRQYVNLITDVIVGAEAARVVREKAARGTVAVERRGGRRRGVNVKTAAAVAALLSLASTHESLGPFLAPK